MRRQPIIRRLLAGLMLVLFAFSGTPKKFLHDLVARHKDSRSRFAPGSHTAVQQSFYNCHTEDIVVESPFIEGATMPELHVPVILTGGFVEMTARLYAFFPVRYSLRGPPSLI